MDGVCPCHVASLASEATRMIHGRRMMKANITARDAAFVAPCTCVILDACGKRGGAKGPGADGANR